MDQANAALRTLNGVCELLNFEDQAAMIIGQMSAIVPFIYRRSQLLDPIASDLDLGFERNFLYMLQGGESGFSPHHEALAKMLTVGLIAHITHGFPCSALSSATTRSAGGNSVIPSLTSAADALSGPLHGGAAEAAMKLYQQLLTQGDGAVENFFGRITPTSSSENRPKASGIGHAQYDAKDPRVTELLKQIEAAVELAKLNGNYREAVGKDFLNLYEVAQKYIECAAKCEFLTSRGNYANVDSVSGILWASLGFADPEFYTLMFFLSRVVGYTAKAAKGEKSRIILRPAECYNGVVPGTAVWTPIEDRT